MPNRRLMTLAAMVPEGKAAADIGTDHALLPVYLIRQGKAPFVIASDIREGPLEAARRTVAKAGLTGQIEIRLGSGLSVLRPGEVGSIILAGMGGESIIGILRQAPWIQSRDVALLLQPMTKAVELRRWLLTHGFVLEQEHAVEEGRRIYAVMRARFAGAPPVTDELAYYIGGLSPTEGRKLFLRQAAHLRRKAMGEDAQSRAALLALAGRLEERS